MVRSLLRVMGFGLVLYTGALQAQESPNGGQSVIVTHVLSAVTTAANQPITFPKNNAEVIVSIYDIAPGAVLPVHKHPFPRFGYVLAGTLRVTNMQSGKSETYNRGEFTVESIGEWHQGTNPGSEPLKLLVIDTVEKGAKNTVVKE